MPKGRPRARILIQEEEEPLLRQALKSKDAKERDKARLILTAHEKNLSIVELSNLLARSTRTIQKWYNKWREGGYKSLMEVKKAPGNAPRVSPELQQELREKLEEGVMNVEEIQKWLEGQGIHLSYMGARYWMGKLARS